jgi:hypothetical protein
MRRGFDRLAQTARERGEHDPAQGGAVFVSRIDVPPG